MPYNHADLRTCSRLSRLTQPTTSFLMRIFRLAYFLLPPSQSASSHTSHLAPLKQCLHLDPDSPACKPAHRLAKTLDKSFAKLDKFIQENDWMGVVKHVAGPSKEFPGDGFASTFEDALDKHASPELLASSSSVPAPDVRLSSPRRAHILRSMCRAFIKLNLPKKGEVWCDALLAMSEDALKAANEMMTEGSAEVDGWIGKGEALLIREEWDEAVRAFERAAEGSGRSDRDVSVSYFPSNYWVANRMWLSGSYSVTESPATVEAIETERLLQGLGCRTRCGCKDYQESLVRDLLFMSESKYTHYKISRKAAMVAHPDKGGSESKMAAVNEAYEVLTNPGESS